MYLYIQIPTKEESLGYGTKKKRKHKQKSNKIKNII